MTAFLIPGRPTGKGRPKFARRGDRVTTYTDAKTASYENKVALFASQAMAGKPMFEGPVCLTVLAYFAPPKSAPKARREAMLAGETHPIMSGSDADNLLKAIMDGLQGVAFANDRQVTAINAAKRYGLRDQVFVRIEPDNEPSYGAAIARLEDDAA